MRSSVPIIRLIALPSSCRLTSSATPCRIAPCGSEFRGQAEQLGQILDVHVALGRAAASPVTGATLLARPVDQRPEVRIAAAPVDQPGPNHDAAHVPVGQDGPFGLDARGHRRPKTGRQQRVHAG